MKPLMKPDFSIVVPNDKPKTGERQIFFKDTYFSSYLGVLIHKETNDHYFISEYPDKINPLIYNHQSPINGTQLTEEQLKAYDLYHCTSAYAFCEYVSNYLFEYYEGNVPIENYFESHFRTLVKQIVTIIIKVGDKFEYTYLLEWSDSTYSKSSRLWTFAVKYSSPKKAAELIKSGMIYHLADKVKSTSWRTESKFYSAPTDYKGSAVCLGIGNTCLFGPKPKNIKSVDQLSEVEIKGEALYLCEDNQWRHLINGEFVDLGGVYYQKFEHKDIDGALLYPGDQVIIADRYEAKKTKIVKLNGTGLHAKTVDTEIKKNVSIFSIWKVK